MKIFNDPKKRSFREIFHLPSLSIRSYLALSYVLFVLFGLFGTGLYWFAQQQAAAEKALETQLLERVRLLAILSANDQITGSVFQKPAVISALDHNLRVVFITPDLKITRISDLSLSSVEQEYALSLSREAFRGQSISYEAHTDEGETLYAAAPVFGLDQRVTGVVCIFLPLVDFEATMHDLRMQLTIFAIILAALSLIFGVTLAAMFTSPLFRATEMSERVAGGDYSVRLPVRGPLEIAQLSDHLNHMAEELQEQSRMRTLLLSNVTHELARPLGGLRLGVDSLLNGGLKDPQFAEDILIDIGRSLGRIDALMEDLALAARPQQAKVSVHLQLIEIGPLLDEIETRFNPRADSRAIQLKIDLAPHTHFVLADEGRLLQILSNLVDNAIKFSPVGSEVILSAFHCENDKVAFRVKDCGPGISPEDMPHIFEPFFQGRKVPPITPGMGLGLSIVHRLVEAHGGAISLENLDEGGLSVTVTLKRGLN